MEDVMEKIEQMNISDLQKIMRVIEQRFSALYPEWDFLYVALHKDPQLRKQEVTNILNFMKSAEE